MAPPSDDDFRAPIEVPGVVPVIFLRNSVLFPGSIIPIDVHRPRSLELIRSLEGPGLPVIGIVAQRDPQMEDPGPEDVYTVGCAARVLKIIALAKDNRAVVLQGGPRIRVLGVQGSDPFFTVRVEAVPDPPGTDAELDGLRSDLKDLARRVIALMPELPKEATALVDSVEETGSLADLLTTNLDLTVTAKQEILETFDVRARARRVLALLEAERAALEAR
jgi:ATP-dependent Lon protease